jgi:MFS family permease
MNPTTAVESRHARITLVLCTVLHAFTHAYSALLLPLYLLVTADFKLPGVKYAAIVVTVYMVVYWSLSFASGMLADRFNRRTMLAIGLLGNALAILGMGLTRDYGFLIGFAVLGGVAGSLFHPAANAMVPAHFPRSPGMAIGLLGAGSGLGFFLGPQYAGWRAESATWHFASVADWQRPLVELGLIGLFFGVVFLLFAKEAPDWQQRRRRKRTNGREDRLPAVETASVASLASMPEPPAMPIDRSHVLTRAQRLRILGIAFTLGFRDFAGVAGLSLASIFLQKAYGYGTKQAGLVVGCMMLLSVVVNPITVYISPGRRRLPTLVINLLCSALLIPLAAMVSGVGAAVASMCLFQTFQLGSYSVSDAAMLERVQPAVRGRVVGLFLTIAGTMGASGPWIMGACVDALGARQTDPRAYIPLFAGLGCCMIWAMLSIPLIKRLGPTPSPSYSGERAGVRGETSKELEHPTFNVQHPTSKSGLGC